MIKNRNLAIFIFVIILINNVYALEDTQVIQVCGGDDQLIIGCIGDDQTTFLSGEIPAEALTGINAEPSIYVEPEKSLIEKGAEVFEGLDSQDKFYLCILAVILLCVIIYKYKEKRKKHLSISKSLYNNDGN